MSDIMLAVMRAGMIMLAVTVDGAAVIGWVRRWWE